MTGTGTALLTGWSSSGFDWRKGQRTMTAAGIIDLPRGRKRTPGVARTKSGRRSRAADTYSENTEPIMVRMRMFGLSEPDARSQLAATPVGRMFLRGEITEDQYNASQDYIQIHTNWRKALKVPDSLRTASSRGDGPESEGYEEWCKRAIRAYEDAERVIKETQNLHRNRANLYGAVDLVVLQNIDLPYLAGDVRLGLNALMQHFESMAKRRRRKAA